MSGSAMSEEDSGEGRWTSWALRGCMGGALMGMANLVPGISGGTMLLAAGVYPKFISAVAEVSTLRFRKISLVVLASVVATAGVAVVTLAGPVKDFVVGSRWMAYSLFVGLTLGGTPLVWRMIRRLDARVWAAIGCGFAAMALLGLAQGGGLGTDGTASTGGFVMMFVAGVAGASAMILPGISGGYLLLVMGVYVPILGGIHAVKEALTSGDVDALMTPLIGIVIPVGLGVVVGVVVVSNALRWLLAHHEQTTLGVLLGLLVGAVVGLWPFQEGVAPEVGSVFKGQMVTAHSQAEIDPEDFPTQRFTPGLGQVLGALVLLGLGIGATQAVARLGRSG